MSGEGANQAFAGRLLEVSRTLEKKATLTHEESVLRAEALQLTGNTVRSRDEAQENLARPALAPVLQVRCLNVVAAGQADEGNVENVLATSRQAEAIAERTQDAGILAVTRALLLERSCDRAGLASLPLAWQVRRAAARSVDLQARAFAHLTFGRLEARAGHLHTARRHFALARHLVVNEPSLVIAATVDLDEASVLFLMGDTSGALDMALRASAAALESWVGKGKTSGCAERRTILGLSWALCRSRASISSGRAAHFEQQCHDLAGGYKGTDSVLQGKLFRGRSNSQRGRETQRRRSAVVKSDPTIYSQPIASASFRVAEGRGVEHREPELRSRRRIRSNWPLLRLQRAEALIKLGTADEADVLGTAVESQTSSLPLLGLRYLVLGK